MIGVGLLTCDRPDYLAHSRLAIEMHLPWVELFIHEDASRLGVANGKNVLFRAMLEAGCEWLFICEDDCYVISPDVVDGYLEACLRSGYQHLGFGYNPRLNPEPSEVGPLLTIWPHFVAPWSIYSRTCLLNVGLMDEGFPGNLEHVEHTLRLARAGYAMLPNRLGRMADATGSMGWLTNADAPSLIDMASFQASREYWSTKDPETYAMVWP